MGRQPRYQRIWDILVSVSWFGPRKCAPCDRQTVPDWSAQCDFMTILCDYLTKSIYLSLSFLNLYMGRAERLTAFHHSGGKHTNIQTGYASDPHYVCQVRSMSSGKWIFGSTVYCQSFTWHLSCFMYLLLGYIYSGCNLYRWKINTDRNSWNVTTLIC